MNKIIEEDTNFIFTQLKNIVDLSKLNNSNILITGGTGLFGKSILDALIFMHNFYEFKITVLSRNKNNFLFNYPKYNLEFINFISGDIRNFDTSPSCEARQPWCSCSSSTTWCLHLRMSIRYWWQSLPLA